MARALKARRGVPAPGARVQIRDEEWIVRKTRTATHGEHALHVTGLSELVRGRDAIFLTGLEDVKELRPEETRFVADDTAQYRRARLYLEALLRKTPTTGGEITTGHRGAMNVLPYQLDPAAQALEGPRARILMADGVGMGKTIEAGVLLSELIRRGRGERILVVALKSILAQFQQELWARFTIPLVRLDSEGIQRVQRKIPASMNPFHWFDRCIISIDTLKKDTRYFRYLEDCRWDVVVVDECQNVAVRGGGTSQRARLAQLLARTCDSLIFTSATPHDGTARSFASLMNLLDVTAVADEEEYGPEDIRGLYVRRFKKDVQEDLHGQIQERETLPVTVPASAEEEAALRALRTVEFRTIRRQHLSAASKGSGVLFRTTLTKAFLSSARACLQTIDERARRLEKREPGPDVEHDLDRLAELRELVAAADAVQPTKLARFVALLKERGVSKKKDAPRAVVFSERIATLELLREHVCDQMGLKEKQVALFTGQLDDRGQQELVQDFGKQDSAIKVLLCSDAAAEGLNLHWFCSLLVHFDVPWSLITLQQRNGRIDRYGQKETPRIHYLLTRPTDPDLRGDLRILDRLVEREEYAERNLGDAGTLMNLRDAGKEEERVGLGMEEGQSPEEIVPDEPQAAGGSLLDLLLGTGQEATPSGSAKTGAAPALLPDDLSFARLALDEIELHDHVSWLPEENGLELRELPPDLERRYAYLPPELRQQIGGQETRALFTTDRGRVMAGLEDARQKTGKWPTWQLLWELHPFAEWLSDRVLAAFDRHEAPALEVVQGLEPGTACFCFQAVLANLSGRPLLVPWFGITLALDARSPSGASATDFAELATACGLVGERPPTNPGRALPLDRFRALLPLAVSAAHDEVAARAENYRGELGELLAAETARFESWKHKKARLLDAREAALEGRRGAPRRRLEDERRRFERIVADRAEFLENQKVGDHPALRVTCLLHRA